MIIGWFAVNPFVAISQESIVVPTPYEVLPVESATSALDELARDPRLACLRIPSTLITADASESFQHSSQVDHIILGTHAKSTAVCKGEVRSELRDHANGVELVCSISGTVTSQTCGVNGPAVINSTSDTTYTAKKRILFDGRQLSTQPALICATTRVMSDDPITLWIDQLRQGDDLAARDLWNHFFRRLHELARHKLRLTTRPVYSEEDAAQSAFHSVCAGIVAGRFPDLQDRDSLWRLMLVITAQKVANRHRYDQQQRRDVRRNSSDSIFTDSRQNLDARAMTAASREPTPEFAAEFVDICECLFRSLEDSTLKEIAGLKLEGYTDSEIADRLKCSRRTVQRRITIIRRHWQRLEVAHD